MELLSSEISHHIFSTTNKETLDESENVMEVKKDALFHHNHTAQNKDNVVQQNNFPNNDDDHDQIRSCLKAQFKNVGEDENVTDSEVGCRKRKELYESICPWDYLMDISDMDETLPKDCFSNDATGMRTILCRLK